MNFPMQYPLFQFFYWLVNTAGLGGLFVVILDGGLFLCCVLIMRWISRGGETNEKETFTYPTSALHKAGDDK
jgi:hypothetical protein